jgi:hypothetical protein
MEITLKDKEGIILHTSKKYCQEDITVKVDNSLILDTSDATATADEIVKGKTAYINGEKVTGTFLLSSGTTKIVYGDKVELVDGLTVRFRMDFDKIEGFQKGSYLMLQADIDSLRNAIGLTADKIKKGETILGVAGTYEGVTEDITHSGGTND